MATTPIDRPLKKEFVWTDAKSFDTLRERVDGRYLSLDEIAFDQDMEEVSIPLTVDNIEQRKICSRLGFAAYEDPTFAASLVISYVQAFEVIDDAEVGGGDINRVKFANGTLTISCGVPVTLRFQVSAVRVRLVIFDSIVSTYKFFVIERWYRRRSEH